MSSIKIVFMLVVVSIAISCTNAVECYVCVGCNDEFDAAANEENTQTDCTNCVKTWVEGIVTRTCGTGSESNGCNDFDFLGITTKTCYCDTDKCNGSGVPTVSFLALAAVAVMKFIL